MARSVTLAQLLVRVRQRADIESKLQRFADSELTDNINEGIAATYDELIKARGHGYYQTDKTVTTVSGTSLYALDAAFLVLENVATTINGRPITLVEFELAERARLTDPNYGWNGAPFAFRIRGSNIEFLPTPTGVYTITLTIVPAATLLVGTTDTFDGIDGWEELAVCWAARQAAIKNGAWQLVGTLQQDMDSVKDRIRSLASKRNAASPARIIDVRRIEREQRSRLYRCR